MAKIDSRSKRIILRSPGCSSDLFNFLPYTLSPQGKPLSPCYNCQSGLAVVPVPAFVLLPVAVAVVFVWRLLQLHQLLHQWLPLYPCLRLWLRFPPQEALHRLLREPHHPALGRLLLRGLLSFRWIKAGLLNCPLIAFEFIFLLLFGTLALYRVDHHSRIRENDKS